MKLLLDTGVNLAVVDQDGETPLTISNQIEVAKLLLDRGANESVADHKGFTPLISASYKGHV